jgi:hypothetical protein
VLGVGVHVEREVAKDEAELIAEVLLELLDEGKGIATGGALVVPVLYESDGCGGGALGMVFGVDGDG